MNKLRMVVLVILIFLGASAGIVKIMKMPQELDFFQAVGLNEFFLVVFGFVQLLGGVLLIFRRSRLLGALISTATFLASAAMLLAAGAFGFGAISLLPAVMSGWIMWDNVQDDSTASD